MEDVKQYYIDEIHKISNDEEENLKVAMQLGFLPEITESTDMLELLDKQPDCDIHKCIDNNIMCIQSSFNKTLFKTLVRLGSYGYCRNYFSDRSRFIRLSELNLGSKPRIVVRTKDNRYYDVNKKVLSIYLCRGLCCNEGSSIAKRLITEVGLDIVAYLDEKYKGVLRVLNTISFSYAICKESLPYFIKKVEEDVPMELLLLLTLYLQDYITAIVFE